MNQVRKIILDHCGQQQQKSGLEKCQILWRLEDNCRDVKIWRHNLDLTRPMYFMLATALVALSWRTTFLVIYICLILTSFHIKLQSFSLIIYLKWFLLLFMFQNISFSFYHHIPSKIFNFKGTLMKLWVQLYSVHGFQTFLENLMKMIGRKTMNTLSLF